MAFVCTSHGVKQLHPAPVSPPTALSDGSESESDGFGDAYDGYEDDESYRGAAEARSLHAGVYAGGDARGDSGFEYF